MSRCRFGLGGFTRKGETLILNNKIIYVGINIKLYISINFGFYFICCFGKAIIKNCVCFIFILNYAKAFGVIVFFKSSKYILNINTYNKEIIIR